MDKKKISPQQALELLKQGNYRSTTNKESCIVNDQLVRNILMSAQYPFATIFCCSDSRVVPEVVFDQQLGNLFTVRTAGPTNPESVLLGSIEYGHHIGTSLIVVLGHEDCGAIKSTLEFFNYHTFFPGSIQAIVNAILPGMIKYGDNGHSARRTTINNIRYVVNRLRECPDAIIREPLDNGSLEIVGAYYSFDGKVTFLNV